MPYQSTLTLTGMLGYPAEVSVVTTTGTTAETLAIAGTKPGNSETITTVLDLTLLRG